MNNIPAGYKQTEVGVIPEDWEVRCLGSISRVIGGGAFKSQDATQTGIRWLKIANVGVNEILWNDESFLPEQFSNTFRNFLLKEGDYVLALTRPILGGVLKIAKIRQADAPSLLNQRVGKLETIDGYDLEFLYFLFQKDATVSAMQQSMAGTDPPNLSTRGIYSIPCALPPTKAEQEAIAKALSDTDTLIESLEQLIAKKRRIKQGTMQKLLTGKKRLPGFSGEWEVKRLDAVADIRSGGTPSTSQPEFWDGDVFWCTPTDITGLKGFKYLSETSRAITTQGLKCSSSELIPADSVVMTSRATIGECAINVVPVATNQGFKNFIPSKETDVEFLYYLLQTKKQDFISLCGGSTFLEIGKAQLAAFEIKLPKEKTEQTAIATILSGMDAEIAALETKLAKTRQIKQGMMHNLLTGKIRLNHDFLD